MNTNTATQLGRSAFLAGQSSAPFLNAEIATAIANLPVGGGAAQIMKAFTKGWHTANLEALVA